MASSTAAPRQSTAPKAIIFRLVSTACSNSPAPSSWPTIMEMAVPMASTAMEKKLLTVLEML